MRKILALIACLWLSPAYAQLVLPGSSGGGGGTPGGASTDLQFNSGGSTFGGDSGFTYAGAGGSLTLTPAANIAQPFLVTGGSTTGSGTSKLGLSIVGTLNTSGVVDGAAIFANVLNTGSGANTYLIDLQVGSASQFRVNMAGQAEAIKYYFTGQSAGFDFVNGAGNFGPAYSSNTGVGVGMSASTINGLTLGTSAFIQWSTGNPNAASSAFDTGIIRDGAGLVALREPAGNASAAHTLRVYNIFTSTTSYERGTFDWNNVSNTLSIGTEKGSGGGSVRNMEFIIGGTNELDFGVTTAGIWTSATAFGAPTFKSSGSVPVDGGGACTATVFTGGASAGTFKTVTGCAGNALAITFAFTAPTGWSCDAEDQTTPATGKFQQNATTTTKATFLATSSSNDIIQYKCTAY